MSWQVKRLWSLRAIAKKWANVTFQGAGIAPNNIRRAAERGFLEGIKYAESQRCLECNAIIGCTSHCSQEECYAPTEETTVSDES